MLWWITLVLTYLFIPVFPMLLFRVWGFWIKSLLIIGFFAGSLILLILLDALPSNWMAGTGAAGPSTSEDYAAIYLTPWFIIPIALIFLNFIFSLRARGLREVISEESIMKASKILSLKGKIKKIFGIKFVFPNKFAWGKTGWLVLTQDKISILDQENNTVLSFMIKV